MLRAFLPLLSSASKRRILLDYVTSQGSLYNVMSCLPGPQIISGDTIIAFVGALGIKMNMFS
jgi:hypothetical protein